MSADFWAGFLSGGAAIIIGNPMERTKVRLQAQYPLHPFRAGPTLSTYCPTSVSTIPSSPSSLPSLITTYVRSKSPLLAGTAAPILGYSALNSLLLMVYNRTEDALNRALLTPTSINPTASDSNGINDTRGSNLWATWLAGAAGGLAIWFISTPTELIKCRAQLASLQGTSPLSGPMPSALSSNPSSSYRITQAILRNGGIRGLYHGGGVTVLRDTIGYGFYFWAYELGGRIMDSLRRRQLRLASSSLDMDGIPETRGSNGTESMGVFTQETVKVLLAGGVAGVVSWASVFPLDVIKTRVQGQIYPPTPLNGAEISPQGTVSYKKKGALEITREAYREGGARVFFRGLMVCTRRAFLVNAVQWLCYEWAMLELEQRNHDRRRESLS